MKSAINSVILLAAVSLNFCAAKTLDVRDFGAVNGKNVISAINSAIQAAEVGDEVFIAKGVWQVGGQPIFGKSGITLRGAGINETVIEHMSKVKEHPFILIEAVSEFTVTGLTLDGKNNPLCTHGVDGGNVSRIEINKVCIRNLVESSEFGTFGVFFNGNARDCLVNESVFENIGISSKWGAAIQVSQLPSVPASKAIIVTNNLIQNTGRGGVLLQNTTSAIVKNNVIRGTGSSGDDGLSIELFDSCDFGIVANNIVDHWISVDGGSYMAIRNNLVKDDPGRGLQFAGIELAGESSHCVVADNRIDGGCQIGLSVSNAGLKENFLFIGNSVKSSETFGVQIQGDEGGAKQLYFCNNTVENTKQSHLSFTKSGGHGFRVNGNVQQLVLDNNTFRSNKGSGIQIRTDNATALPVDRLSFRRNRFESNQQEFLEVEPELVSQMKSILWHSSNTFSGGGSEATIALPNKGFTSSPKADNSIIHSSNDLNAVKVGDRILLSVDKNDREQVSRLLWDFGIGVPSTEEHESVVYKKAGAYEIRLVTWDSVGRASMDQLKVTVE